MAWCFADETTKYTEYVLNCLTTDWAHVPAIWPLEVANVLLVAERKKRLSETQSIRFIEILQSLPIVVDSEEDESRAFRSIMPLARQFDLSSYDAAYLELAVRKGIPLATLDKGLKNAAKNYGARILS